MAIDSPLTYDQDTSVSYLDRRLVRGSAVLMTTGFLVWLTGVTTGTIALVSGCRRRVAAREKPPLTTARHWLGQARSSVGAGVEAWQKSSLS